MNLTRENKTERKIPALIFTRCCGYFSLVYHGSKKGTWNNGKMEEYNDRKYIDLEKFKNSKQ